MNKTLATLALAAVPALVLSACNGNGAGAGPGVSALPNAPAAHHGRVRPNDNGPQDLHAGGSTFAAYAYNLANQPVGQYNQAQAPPGQGSLFYSYGGTGTIYYCLTGSGFGIKEFTGQSITATVACAPLGASPTGFGGRQDPLDFVGSDAPLASTDCCGSSTYYYINRLSGSVTWGQPFEIPAFGGPIVYGFRPQDFSAQTKTIRLSAWTYCAIANGTVADWNDPAVTADNGKSVTGGVSQPITFYFRSDSSGTTFVYTTDLNAQCNITFKPPYNSYPYGSGSRSASWPYGVSKLWPGPGGSGPPNAHFIGESGNPGVLAGIQSTPFATGYVEGAYAASANPKVGQAYLQNGYSKKKHMAIFVSPTNKTAVKNALANLTPGNISYGEGGDGSSLGSSTPWCQLEFAASVYDMPKVKSYPIVGPTYLDFYGNNNAIHVADKTKLIKYLMSLAANAILAKLEYAQLPSATQSAVLNALNGSSSQAACLQ